MKIAEIGKSQKTLSRLGSFMPRGFFSFKMSSVVVLGVVFATILVFEVWGLYAYLFKNLLFIDDPAVDVVESSARINFKNYDKVLSRLDRVAGYSATTTPQIIEPGGGGRQNPFTDPAE